MFKRILRIKSTYLVLCSIFLGFITVASLIAELMGYKGFAVVQMVCMYAALIMGIAAIVQICINWRDRGVAGFIELLALVFAGFLLFSYMVYFVQNFRMYRAVSHNMLYLIHKADKMMDTYVQENGKLPDADNWCDNVTKDKDAQGPKYEFKVGHFPEIECTLAFNKSLGNLSAVDLPGNTVLLFEADGYWNFCGGPELIQKERAKDAYVPFKRQKFIYVLFVDHTIVKYRLRDGSVAKYIPDEDRFTEYYNQAETPYSPLKWNP